jgi:Ca2+-binding RTX toxin-like protein
LADIPGNKTTTAVVTVGSTTNGTLESVSDHDWYKITLSAGQAITVTINGVTLEDPFLNIYDSTGNNVLYTNDDINPGIERDSRLSFSANYSGVYYIDVGSFEDSYSGTFQLAITTYTPPPLATVDQIATQLTSGYWGGATQHFNVTQGGTIDVNVSGLTAEGKTLARAALDLWSDVIGVTFHEVTSGGQILFDDSQAGAYTSSNTTGGFIDWSSVNISTQWLIDNGTTLDSYSFQTYIHEIGHALGLGHAGNYNADDSGTPITYPYDALFQNDAWSTSIMSYFSQTDNTYFSGQGFTFDYAVSPMMADIVAMQSLYGLSTTTRTGDTTYGFNSTAGRAIYDATQYTHVAYTIFDSGGVDTLDYSGYSAAQVINLNPETFSNVGGDRGNVSIGRGVVIENAIGGSGADTLTGNGADNWLQGNGGNDTLNGGTGDDRLSGGSGTNALNGGAGSDTADYSAGVTATVTANLATGSATYNSGAAHDNFNSVENLLGSTFNDVLTGDANANVIEGNLGNDTLDGGAGVDTVSYAHAAAAVTVNLATAGAQNTLAAGSDTLSNFENLAGSGFNDTLTGNAAANVVSGGGGNDLIDGAAGADTLVGGLGNDMFVVDNAGDVVSENFGEGTDQVNSSVSYVLGANLENLLLTGGGAIDGTGNGFANVIAGNAAANVLDGDTGADTLIGGAGNDTYIVDNSGDVVTEAGGEGTDQVDASASFTLGANVENLTLTGGSAIAGTGNALANLITGNSAANALAGGGGDDVLNGGAGADSLAGGAGDDTYIVDNAGDTVTENAGEGSDTVQSSVTFTLAAEIENLTLTGAAIGGTGNELGNTIRGTAADNALTGNGGDDYLFGNAGNDSLTGGAGYDRMYGGIGDDTYYLGDATDFAYENAGEGHDTAIASVDATLRDEVEDLVLTGSAFIGKGNVSDNAITGTDLANKLYGYEGNDTLLGNGGDDYLFAAEGNDTLAGGAGYDRMYGGLGDDTYYVTDTTDFAYENLGEGNDTVVSSLASYQLRANVEELDLAEGSAAVRGYGQASDNVIVGNSADDFLYGRDGNDHLLGGAGADLLYGENGNDTLEGGSGMDRFYGGTGADTFLFRDGDFAGLTSGTADRIHDFAEADSDKLDFSNVDANSLLGGDQAFAFIGSAAFGHHAGELRYYQQSGVTYVAGDTNGDGTADFAVRIDGLHTIVAGELIL